MNKSFWVRLKRDELLLGSDFVCRFTFKMIDTRDNYALLARTNNQLAADFANTREQSILFQEKDCFECLSPHEIAA